MTTGLSPISASQNATLLPPSQGKLSRTWTICFDKQMVDFEIDKLILPRINSHQLLPLDKIQLPIYKKDLYVGWDATKIIKSPITQLIYSTEFSACIAVLVRGFKSSNLSCPSHLGLAHVMGSPQIIEPMILEIERETSNGPIEIFICGGYRNDKNSFDSYMKLMELIQNLSRTKPHIRVLDDQFSIMDIPQFYLITKNGMAYTGCPGLGFAGFDVNHNPYVVLGVQFRSFKGSRQDVAKFMREENSEVVDCLHLTNKEDSPASGSHDVKCSGTENPQVIDHLHLSDKGESPNCSTSRLSLLVPIGAGLLISGITIYALVNLHRFFSVSAASKYRP